jgi:hypothetical protein
MAVKKPDEAPDLALAKKLVFDGPGLSLERFTHSETVKGPTPDFLGLLVLWGLTFFTC